jgi:thymidylate kinase
MKYILIGGAESVGKTESICRLEKYLINKKGFNVLKRIPQPYGDFMAILAGKNKNGEKIRIAINSASDTIAIIRAFKKLLDENKNISLVISSIRDNNFFPRKEFLEIIDITENDIDIELPLARITRRGEKRKTALKWYKEKIDTLLIKLLKESYL